VPPKRGAPHLFQHPLEDRTLALQSVDFEKGLFEADGSTIDVHYVLASHSKPVVCLEDGSGLFFGDIYSYTGESQCVQAAELEPLLCERDTRAGDSVFHLVRAFAETEGAATLRVVGDVQPIGNATVTPSLKTSYLGNVG
jgi:hypothetical protein